MVKIPMRSKKPIISVPHYSKEQIDFLRNSLCAFQRETGLGYPAIAEDIYHSEAFINLEFLFKNDRHAKGHPIDKDALRKFSKGETTLASDERLYLVYLYLKEQEALNEGFFDKIGSLYRDAHIFADFFQTSENSDIFPMLDNTYYSREEISKYRKKERLLNFYRKDEENFLRFRMYELYTPLDSNEEENVKKVTHKYGWISISDQKAFLFLNNRTYTTPNPIFYNIYQEEESNLCFDECMDFLPNTLDRSNLSFKAQKKKYRKIDQEQFDKLYKNMEIYFYVDVEDDPLRKSTRLSRDQERTIRVPIKDKIFSLIDGSSKDDAGDQKPVSICVVMDGNDNKKGQKFLRDFQDCDFASVRAYLESGGDINYEDPHNRIRAIHLAATDISGNMLKKLSQLDKDYADKDESKRLNYLARTKDGFLASSIAFIESGNTALGNLFIDKEIEYAERNGIDYKAVMRGEDRPSVDSDGCTPI